ncbi:MAG: hypothetical protein H7844_02100 [Nitrospirae bacterium YQR-1]
MQVPVIIFSADELRGHVLSKVFKKGGCESSLYKAIADFGALLFTLKPGVVVLDSGSFFPGELERLSDTISPEITSHIVLLSEPDDSVLSSYASAYCPLSPFDPEGILDVALKLLKTEKKKEHFGESTSLTDTLKLYLKLD